MQEPPGQGNLVLGAQEGKVLQPRQWLIQCTPKPKAFFLRQGRELHWMLQFV